MAEEKPEVSGVSVAARVPEFWQDLPRHWFIQAEAVLHPQKMSDDARYQFIISKLGKDAIQQVTDILINPPEKGKYDALKERLLEIYEESETRKVQKLISEMDLGEQNPSHLLRKMQELARGKITNETLCVMWQNLLPAAVRGVLAATESGELEKLARIADKVMETMKTQPVAEVTQRGVPSDSPAVLAEIAKITARLDQLSRSRADSRSRRGRGGFRGRSTSRRRDFNRTRRTPDSPEWLCFYHYRYKDKANKCVKPCSWKSEN